MSTSNANPETSNSRSKGLIYLGIKRPWQIYALTIIYLFGVAYVGNQLYEHVLHKRNLSNLCIIGFPILLFSLLIVLLFIRQKWVYILSIAILIPIYIYFGGFMIVLLFFPNIETLVVPIFAIFTLYALFCSATRTYFKVKGDKIASE